MERGDKIRVDRNIIALLKKARDQRITGPEIAKSLRDSEGVSIDEAEAALREIGFTTARTQSEPNKLNVLKQPEDWYAVHPESGTVDWDERV